MTKESDNTCLILFGPTASGKSAAAIALARAFDGVIINADSMQIYRDLRLLTARPSPEEEATVPHRLYGVLGGEELCSAARWRDMALAEIHQVLADGKRPILCGGTGFYLSALTEGLSPMPVVPDDIRATVRAAVAASSGVESWDRLQAIDPIAARRIEPMDRQRVSRALEVYAATGRPLSSWQAEPLDGAPPGLRFLTLVLNPPRQEIYQRCDARLDTMIAAGALDEVSALMARNLPAERPVTRAVGVPELTAYLRGELPLDTALEQAKRSTRQYAKRQTTWIKNKIVTQIVYNEKYSESLMAKIISYIEFNGLIRV